MVDERQTERDNLNKDWKRDFNIAFSLCMMHQRALTVPMRKYYGTNALALPCVLALALMVVWWMATRDPFMLGWIGLWFLCFIKNRIEAVRLAWKNAGIHSYYDGWPTDAMKFCRSEKIAKMFVEPIYIGILGFAVFQLYQHMGWRPTGLPYFLLAGIFTLPFTEAVKQSIWQRKIQAMADARNEQEAMVDEFHNRFGR